MTRESWSAQNTADLAEDTRRKQMGSTTRKSNARKAGALVAIDLLPQEN